ncbi:MAG: polysaccharide biosynthesis/export family protein, partial [Candidatus Acidiferrales bacterium]
MLKQLMICLALSFMVLAAQAQNQEKPKGDAQAAAPDNSMAAARKAATEDPNYTIGPQDVLDISVWKEPELTRSVPVRPDGKISMPLLNDVQAAGLTPSQLAAQIT